jgi:hypothetical protein
MKHFYESITGWFDFEDLYQAEVENAQDGAHFVEVGSFLGKSAAYMGVEIANSGKRIRFDACDLFTGVSEREFTDPEGFRLQESWKVDGSLEHVCRQNLAPVADHVNVRVGDSLSLAQTYADASLDFVFLDDDHTTPHVLKELDAWWPKVKPGGVLAGHDMNWQWVEKAVTTWAARKGLAFHKTSVRCWAIEKHVPAKDWFVPAKDRKCLVAICTNERTIARKTVDSAIRLGWGNRINAACERWEFSSIDYHLSDRQVSVADMRDEAALVALKGGYSHVLMLDADNTWPHDLLARMLAHHSRGIVSGLYFLKQWPNRPVALRNGKWNELDQAFDYEYDVAAVGATGLRREELVGMGCTLIPTEVFKRLPRPWFQYRLNGSGFSTITEDVTFCESARSVDCPIWLDPEIECGHVSQEIITSSHCDRSSIELAMLLNQQRLETKAHGSLLVTA